MNTPHPRDLTLVAALHKKLHQIQYPDSSRGKVWINCTQKVRPTNPERVCYMWGWLGQGFLPKFP